MPVSDPPHARATRVELKQEILKLGRAERQRKHCRRRIAGRTVSHPGAVHARTLGLDEQVEVVIVASAHAYPPPSTGTACGALQVSVMAMFAVDAVEAMMAPIDPESWMPKVTVSSSGCRGRSVIA